MSKHLIWQRQRSDTDINNLFHILPISEDKISSMGNISNTFAFYMKGTFSVHLFS